MTQEEIAINEEMRQLASNFLGGQPYALVSQETLEALLFAVSICTLKRVKRDMFAITFSPRPAINPGRRKNDIG